MDVAKDTRARTDWVGSFRSYSLAWGLPTLAIFVALSLGVVPRMAIWVIALLWMGMACLINARRCGRVHCRFTGPFYLLMILPVVASSFGIVSIGKAGWVVLAFSIPLGAMAVWHVTERIFGGAS